MKLKIYLVIISFLFANMARSHDIHLSVTEISIDGSGKMEISIRIFLDDLLLACGLSPGEPLPSDYSSSDELIEKYLEENFMVYSNDKLMKFEFTDSYSDDLAVGIELSISENNIDEINNYTLKNTILLEQFDDQMNLVNIDWDGRKSALSFDKKSKQLKIN